MKTCADRHDVAGMGIGRTARRALLCRLTPYGSCAYGLHVSQLLTLALRHWLGLPAAWLTLRYERHWMRLLSRWRRLRTARRPGVSPEASADN